MTKAAFEDPDAPSTAEAGAGNANTSPTPQVEEGLPVAVGTQIGVLNAGNSNRSNLTQQSTSSHNVNAEETSSNLQNAAQQRTAPVDQSKEKPKSLPPLSQWIREHRILVTSFSLLVLVGIGVAVGLPLSGNRGGSEPPKSSTMTPPKEKENAQVVPNGFPLTTTSLCFSGTCSWHPIGPDLEGPGEGDFFGAKLRLCKSPEGSRFSASTPYYNNAAGFVSFYDIVQSEDGSGAIEYRRLGRDIVPRFFGDMMSGIYSDDGTHILVSSTEVKAGKGHVRIYRQEDSGEKIRVANDLNGLDDKDEFGRAAINRDGSIIAVSDTSYDPFNKDKPEETVEDAGVVRIYSVTKENKWKPIGNFLHGKTPREHWGLKLVLSGDGRTIAVSSSEHDKGSKEDEDYGAVRVSYLTDDGKWYLLGKDIVGENKGDRVGEGMTLSADGLVLAVSMYSPWVDGDMEGMGLVRVFRYNIEENNWDRMGSDILSGTSTPLDFGFQIELSDDGKRMAIGQPRYTPSDDLFEAGRLQVFDFVDDDWEQVGQDILGEHSCDVVGTGFDLSPDGSRMIVGFPNAEGLGNFGPACANDGIGSPVPGYVRLYELLAD